MVFAGMPAPPPLMCGDGLALVVVMRWITLLAFLGFAATASAQTDATNTWSRGTTLEIFGGAAIASPNTTGTFGATVGWELTHRAEIEGVAAWLAQRKGTEAFAADLKLLISLTRPAGIVPYVGGGAGLYRGTFEPARVAMPAFYQRRDEDPARTRSISFTDPSVVIAAGAHLFVSRHFSIRPELGMRIVTNRSNTYRVTTVTFGEFAKSWRHPSTPSRTRCLSP